MNNTQLTALLAAKDACSDAVTWIGKRSPRAAWNTCKRGDWMLWFAVRIGVDKKLLVLAACACAEPALKHVPDGEDRPANALAVARAWCAGKASLKAVRKAAAAADAAAADAAAYADAADAYAAAAYAAYAADADAAYAADAYAAAAYAAYAADDAYAAADAAAYAAKKGTLKQCADIVRKHYPKAPKIK